MYNEVLHLLERRLEKARAPLDRYLTLINTNPIVVWFIRIIRFLLGTLLTVLLVGYDSSNLPFISVLGVIMLGIYNFSLRVFPIGDEAEEYLAKVYLKLGDRVEPNILPHLYQRRIVMFLMELVSIVVVPLYLLFYVRREAEKIVETVQTTSIYNNILRCYVSVDADFSGREDNERTTISHLTFSQEYKRIVS
jgi:hypothetical protein